MRDIKTVLSQLLGRGKPTSAKPKEASAATLSGKLLKALAPKPAANLHRISVLLPDGSLEKRLMTSEAALEYLNGGSWRRIG